MSTNSSLIMVVTDELYMCSVVSSILEREGYEVITASDIETATWLNQQREPWVILLDIMMPGIDGREVCQRFRESSPGIRIIYFTPRVDPDRGEPQDDAGTLVIRPSDSRQVLAAIVSVP